MPVSERRHPGMLFLPDSGRSCPPMCGSARYEQRSDRGLSDPCEHQKIIGYDGTPDIPFEPLPSRPGTAVEAEGPFEGGDARLDAGAEVPELLIHPGTLRHVRDCKTASFGKDCVLDAVVFGKGKILL